MIDRVAMTGLGQTVAALGALRTTIMGDGSSDARLTEIAEFGSNPGGLRMRLYTPAALTPGAALVVALHGCTQTADGYASGAGWLTLAERWGFAVLCPEQTRSNNPNLCFNWFEPGDTACGVGEAASIQAMITRALRDHQVDPGRVFITGLSAGAAMANVMLAVYPQTFAGGALVCGLPFGAAHNVHQAMAAMRNAHPRSPQVWGDAVRAASGWQGPWPSVSIWQGEEDTTVRPGAADELVGQWTNVHGLDLSRCEPVVTSARDRCVRWRKPSGEVAVDLHRIAGMGHGVPIGCAVDEGCGHAGPYLLEVGVSSSLEIARSWGLLNGRRLQGSEASPGVANARSAGSVDVGAIITGALRGVGLIR